MAFPIPITSDEMVFGDGEGCCTCRFWTRAFCGKCCFCCPIGCETSFLNCCRGIQNWIYCFQKYLCIIVAIPKAILWVIKEIFCCLMLYILLGLVFAFIIFLLRFFCDEVIDFLDFLFVSGGGGGGGLFPFTRAAVSSAQYTWNTLVPFVSPLLVIAIDTMLSVHQTLTTEIGTQQLEELFLDLSANTHVLTEMLFNLLSAVVESDPEDLVGLSLISKELTMRTIESHSLLLNSFDLSTGGGWAAIVPLIYSANQLAISAALVSSGGTGTGRKLLSLNGTSQRSPYDTMGTAYIQSIQRGYQDLNGQCDVDQVLQMAQETAHQAHSIRQTTRGRDSSTPPGKQENSQNRRGTRKERLEKTAMLLKHELTQSLRSYNEKMSHRRDGDQASTSIGARLIKSMGFETLDGMVQHVRSEYGDGRGFLYSLAPHKYLADYTRPYSKDEDNPYRSDIHFSDYLEQAGMSGKEYAAMTGGGDSSHAQRKLLQILPGPLDILDCFTDIPPDPLCILGFILPLPLDPPPFLDPVLGFDCDCDDYDADCFGLPALMNSLLVLQTIISLFSSIEALGIQDFFMSITLPDFILDNLFLDSPGDAPGTSAILCAILHLDCFLLVAIIVGLILLFVFAVLKAIADIWNCCQDLRLINEHEKIYRMTCVKMRNSDDVDATLSKYLNESLLNPGVRDYGDANAYGKPDSYWREDVEGTYGDRPIVYGPAASEWFPRMYPGDLGPDTYQRKKWTAPQGARIGQELELDLEEASRSSREIPHHSLTTQLQTKMIDDAAAAMDTPVSVYRKQRMYHILHPEESIYRGETLRSITEELLGELGVPLDASQFSEQDLQEITQSETTPYMVHENTQVFLEDVHSVLTPPDEERTIAGGLASSTAFEYAGLR